jgi:hypothetical protein
MEYIFTPFRRTGLIVHTLATLGLAGGCGVCIWLALQQQVGADFVLLILAALLLFAPLPVVAYRGYALLTAQYSLERDGLRLRWGLRAEDIPLPDVEWVRPATDLAFDLPLPRFSMPGAILGSVNLRDFGPVEYLASDKSLILLLATPLRVYAISPADPAGFIQAFQYATEMGSLSPLHSVSVRPAAFLRGVWQDQVARVSVLTGLLLTLALFVLVGFFIPTLPSISLGFTPAGQPVEPGPSARLLLLPVLCTFTFVIDLFGGAFFYRHEDWRPVAYLLWIGAIVTPVLLLLGTLFLI